ncbi:MAG TPA: hypothetical protein VF070_30625 [Streptosporangiaceae bacterium]
MTLTNTDTSNSSYFLTYTLFDGIGLLPTSWNASAMLFPISTRL